jgi:hypothetical protein
MFDKYSDLENFYTQYLDEVNVRYIHMDKEEREKKLSIMFKRFLKPINEYYKLLDDINDAVSYHGCHPTQIKSNMEYPEEIVW